MGEVTRCGPRTSEIGQQRSALWKQAGEAGFLVGQRQQDVLGGDVLVGEPSGLLLGLLQDPDELLGGADVGNGVAAQRGQLRDRIARAGAKRLDILAEALQHRHDDALLLL